MPTRYMLDHTMTLETSDGRSTRAELELVQSRQDQVALHLHNLISGDFVAININVDELHEIQEFLRYFDSCMRARSFA